MYGSSRSKYGDQEECRNFASRKRLFIESFRVEHPLFDSLVNAKINKCLAHGCFRSYESQKTGVDDHHIVPSRIIIAPSLEGHSKAILRRPATSRGTAQTWMYLKSEVRPTTSNLTSRVKMYPKSESRRHLKAGSRPKSTSTVIRSRTSEPRIVRKLQILSKQLVDEQQQLKPSLISHIFKSNQHQQD